MRKSNIRQKTAFALWVLTAVLSTACSGKKSGVSYEFTNIRRGTLERTVSSSGKINPVSTVRVLPQMSGKVEKIFVDYNDPIRKGDILAELNTDVLKLKREQQYAAVIKARANYELQQINYRNQQVLAEKNLISEYELKTSKTTLDSQAADLAVAEANYKEIETEINQYAYIKSPIDGIVLDRNINVGDTVVDSSSNNSSSIFTVAENLREMQIEAMVGELDVVSIRKGQIVRFSLESLPGRNFSGEVESLRMVPVVSNNVVSYTVIVKVENQDGALLPGMTCAVDFIVERSENVLMVSNAALRYQPTNLSAEKIADMVFNAGLEGMNDEQREAALEAAQKARAQTRAQNAGQNQGAGLTNLMMGGGQQGRMMGGGSGGGRQTFTQRQGQGPGQGARRGEGAAIVMRNIWYVSDEGKLEVMRVRAGISSGSFTEIHSREDVEGKQVILREKI
ncbi:MAG: efflux RND transporter periplasmic adaptor subunit [Treponema sp.]|jgi:HlyD family secretion protein|nr:efflux RND transporter periplasmic adaptor subunit [Treponema sp.]